MRVHMPVPDAPNGVACGDPAGAPATALVERVTCARCHATPAYADAAGQWLAYAEFTHDADVRAIAARLRHALAVAGQRVDAAPPGQSGLAP